MFLAIPETRRGPVPGLGLVIFGAQDPEYPLACFQCYNHALRDFCVEPQTLN